MKSTEPDLAALYNHNMECQVNVAEQGGDKFTGEYKGKTWHGYTDGVNVWKSFRIPYNANSTPEYEDRPMKFDLFTYAEGIGMTGWDWKMGLSRWVAFDFDLIMGHSDKHTKKLTPEQLMEVTEAAKKIPWVTVRHSTSGKGLHLYVHLDPVETANHSEHAAVARSILGLMSAETGFDFSSRVDICGGNMWVWHRKMKGTNGLKIIKPAETVAIVPPNWRDHLKVITGQRRRTIPGFVEDEMKFEELTGQRAQVPLDEEHRKLIQFLQEANVMFWWDQDHHMLVAHTYDLKRAHSELNMRGIFDTIATGSMGGLDHNCFMFPMRRGAWSVRRYGAGTGEHESWDQDASGYTRCYLNREPDIWCSARTNGGIEDPKGGFEFRDGAQASKAAEALGVTLALHPGVNHRPVKMKEHKDGRLIVAVGHEQNDTAEMMPGWLLNKKEWIKMFNLPRKGEEENDVGNYDDIIRHIVSEGGEDMGWSVKSEDCWRDEPLAHIKAALKTLGAKANEVDLVLGGSVFKPWKIVNYPFQPEYPGDRKWNRFGAQFKVAPDLMEESSTPTWNLILDHVGKELDNALTSWCKKNKVLSGADYLRLWIASMFQFPTEPLPYLFLYGPQNSGKSILHEAIELLIDRGVVRADYALAVSSFNAELDKCILAIVEETDLRANKSAYEKIKDWVTARQIAINEKYRTPRQVTNTTHWIQCANDKNFCPIFAGDTRITVIHVEPLQNIIPKKDLIVRLLKEAPAFLGAMLKLEIPPSNDRLNVPVLETESKANAAKSNQSLVELFIDEHCHYAPGYMIPLSEFYMRFEEWLEPAEKHNWSKIKVSKQMPDKFPKGRYGSNSYWYWGNLSFEKPTEEKKVLFARDAKLCSEG